MKAYKLTGYTPFWIYDDKIINHKHIEDILSELNIIDPWIEIPRNNFTWNDITSMEYRGSVDEETCYIKVVQGSQTYYYKKVQNSVIRSLKDDNLLVTNNYILDEWNTYIYDLLDLLMQHNCLVHFKRTFLDRLKRYDDFYRLNFSEQKYLSDLATLPNLSLICDFVNGTTAAQMYTLNNPTYAWNELPTDYVVHNWKYPERTITVNIKNMFGSADNNSKDNHRFCYIIAKSSALRQIIDSKDTSNDTTQKIVVIPLPWTEKDKILHALDDINPILTQDSCLIVGSKNTIGAKLVEVSFALLFDWYVKNTDKASFCYAKNWTKEGTGGDVDIPFFLFPFNQPFLWNIFDYFNTNSKLGIGKMIKEFVNNLDMLTPDTEPLMFNPAYYNEVYNNGINQYTTSFQQFSLDFPKVTEQTRDTPHEPFEELKLQAYFTFFDDISMSFYYGENTNTLLTGQDNTKTNTVNISIPFGLAQGASANMLENNLNTGYTGLLNRNSEKTWSWLNFGVDTYTDLLTKAESTALSLMSGNMDSARKGGMGLGTGFFKGIFGIFDMIGQQERADRSFYAGIRNAVGAPSSISSSPFPKANIPIFSVDNKYLFLMFAYHLHPQSRDLVFSDYLHNGYVYDAEDNINVFDNRKYMNVLAISTQDKVEDIFNIWSNNYENNIFKNKFWFTRAMGFLGSVHNFYKTTHLINCTNYKGENYIHNVEKEPYDIQTIRTNINNIIRLWPTEYPADISALWEVLKGMNAGLTNDIVSKLDLILNEGYFIINVKPEYADQLVGQLYCNCYIYNSLFTIDSQDYAVYDFNDACGTGTSFVLHHSGGETTINKLSARCTRFKIYPDSTINHIDDNFAARWFNFQAPLTDLGNIKTIGEGFLNNVLLYNQNINIPQTLTSIGNGFLWCCNYMTGVIDFGEVSYGVLPADRSKFLTTVNNTAEMYTTGVTIKTRGPWIPSWELWLPNLTTGPQYRKVIFTYDE